MSVGRETGAGGQGPSHDDSFDSLGCCQGNYARIHWDLPFAQIHQGLSNVVVNGSLKNQYLGQLMIRLAGPEGWFKRFYVEHRGMDYPGISLPAQGCHWLREVKAMAMSTVMST
ncbi:MAG: hypothetical protein CM1200mP22_17610 [Dehalococcoidia bacterium]|nr:MAG: hypothetical protein CM1200mP22_17610 [Dehalococcoidia bacterium]